MNVRDPLQRDDELGGHLRSLNLLLNGFTDTAMQVQALAPTSQNEPPTRPVLTRTHLLLPGDVAFPDGSDRHRTYRAAVAHAVAHLRHSPVGLPSRTLKPMSIAVVSAIEDARVERLLTREFPGLRGWFLEILRRGAEEPGLGFASLMSRMSLAVMEPRYEDDNHWVNKARTLFEAQAVDLSDYAAFRRIGAVLANDLGQMRVRFDPRLCPQPVAYRDDNSFLWDHGEPAGSPETLELHTPGEPPFSRKRERGLGGDGHPLAPSSEVELGRLLYPEWDHRLCLIRADWCTVIEKRPAWQGGPVDGGRAGATAVPLVLLPSIPRLNRRRRLRRQREGDDIDLDAAIEAMVDKRLDHRPDPRWFMRSGREGRAASVLVLLDLSESTHDPVRGTQRSILDIEKDAALMLGQSVLRGGHRIAIHGFSSNTRAEVSYYRLLDFGAALDAAAIARIRDVPARHSTRIGAALRHAAACLAGEPGDDRAIIVVTDGAPSDVDVFEPGHLLADARAAVAEARQAGVRTCGVLLDSGAAGYAGTMFGWGNFQVVDDPRTLPMQLSRLWARLSM